MNLLFPSLALLGLSAAGVVLLHLFVQGTRPPRRLPTARFLPNSAVRKERKINRDDLILMLLRSAAVLALAFFAAAPIWVSGGNGPIGKTQELWVVDTSMSMFEHDVEGLRPVDRVASALMESATTLQRVVVVACDMASVHDANHFVVLDSARMSIRQIATKLKDVTPTAVGFGIEACWQALSSDAIIDAVDGLSVRLFSDFRGKWVDIGAESASLPQDIVAHRVQFVGPRQNRWFVDTAVTGGRHGQQISATLGGVNETSDPDAFDIEWHWADGGPTISLTPSGPRVSAEVKPNDKKWRARWQLSSDALDIDNVAFEAGQRQQSDTVIVRESVPGVGVEDPTYFLVTALRQFKQGGAPVKVRATTPDRLPTDDVALLVLYDLPAHRSEIMEAWLRAHPATRVLAVAGPALAELESPQPVFPWPGVVRGMKERDPTSLAAPVLKLPGAVLSDAEIERILVLGEVPTGVDVLATWGDDPLLLRDARGSYLLSTLDPRWATLAASRWMLPLVAEILVSEIQLATQRVVSVGASESFELSSVPLERLTESAQSRFLADENQSGVAQLTAPAQPGQYAIPMTTGEIVLLVQPDRTESAAEDHMSTALSQIGVNNGAEVLGTADNYVDLSKWFGVLIALFLLAEVLFIVRQRRLAGILGAMLLFALGAPWPGVAMAQDVSRTLKTGDDGALNVYTLGSLQPSADRKRALELAFEEVKRRTALVVGSQVQALPEQSTQQGTLLWLPGCTQNFPASKADHERIRHTIGRGGLVIAEDCTSSRESDFRNGLDAFLTESYPQAHLNLPTEAHTLYRSFYLLNQMHGAVPGIRERTFDLGGYSRVLYLPQDLTGALSTSATSGNPARNRELAIRSWVNILMYAQALDYKSDMIHLPFILKRRNRWSK